MSKIQRIKLSKLVEKVEKWNPKKEAPSETFIYIDISSINRDSKQVTDATKIAGSEAPSRARQLVQRNDVLVSTVRPNLNAVAQISDDFDGATASTGYCVLRPRKDSLDSSYLFHWVRTPIFVELMVQQATGASYPAVNSKIVKASKIPLPPLEEQRRIARILDKADALRQKRRAALAKLDTLLQATFLDMFGDPVTNPMGWEVKKLSNIADIESGVTKSKSRIKGKETVEVPYMRVANVQDGEILTGEQDIKTIKVLPQDAERYILQYGDILLTEGGDPDKLGRGGIWRGEIEQCIHQNHIYRVRLDSDQFIPEYLSALIGSQYGKRYFLKAAKQTTGIASINKTQLKAFPALVAPLDLQKRFRSFAFEAKTFKNSIENSLQTYDNLFHSLQQRAFSGNL